MSIWQITIDLPDLEQAILERYCQLAQRSQTEVIREFIRTSLKKRLKKLENSTDTHKNP